MVGARFSASLLTAVVVWWIWLRLGKAHLMTVPPHREPHPAGAVAQLVGNLHRIEGFRGSIPS